jgi:predicted DNA-binding antitoxin AbrB/MazE fold protein
MDVTIEAIYENGVLRPLAALPGLKEGQRVALAVRLIAELSEEEFARRYAELVRRLDAAGRIEHLPPAPEPIPLSWKPMVNPGEPLSETVCKMRQED